MHLPNENGTPMQISSCPRVLSGLGWAWRRSPENPSPSRKRSTLWRADYYQFRPNYHELSISSIACTCQSWIRCLVCVMPTPVFPSALTPPGPHLPVSKMKPPFDSRSVPASYPEGCHTSSPRQGSSHERQRPPPQDCDEAECCRSSWDMPSNAGTIINYGNYVWTSRNIAQPQNANLKASQGGKVSKNQIIHQTTPQLDGTQLFHPCPIFLIGVK